MSSYHFRLEQVLDVRKKKENGCKKDLALELATLEREENMLENMYGTLKGYFDAWEDERGTTARTGDDFRMHALYTEHLEKETQQQMQQIKTQEQQVAVVRARLIEASKEKKTLERVKENRLEAHHEKLERRERAFLDDIAMRIHYQNKATA